jgi:hypothetical protein
MVVDLRVKLATYFVGTHINLMVKSYEPLKIGCSLLPPRYGHSDNNRTLL